MGGENRRELYKRGLGLIQQEEQELGLTLGRSYYVMNLHGDVFALTDEEGAVTRKYRYDPFGAEVVTVVTEASPNREDVNPFRYCGEEYDAGLSQLNLRARWYTPATGRFTQEDPAKDGTNWYAYCANDPVNFKDPTGQIAEGDDRLAPELQVLLNGVNRDGNGGLSLAWKLANERGDESAKARIAEEANQIRKFNTYTINSIIVLVQSADPLGAGHTATLLLNEAGQGLLLSYYSENGTAIGPGEMRIAMLSESERNSILYGGGEANLVGSNGRIRSERFNGNFVLSIDHNEGMNAIGKMASLFNNPGQYNLATNNCDLVTAAIVTAADRFYDKHLLPNESFYYTKLYYENYWLWLLSQGGY